MPFKWVKYIIYILKIGSKPYTFVYPIPLASFVAMSISNSGWASFVVSVLFCFLLYTAINLWNHVNDLEDDLRAGKDISVILQDNPKLAYMISILFYILSINFYLTLSQSFLAFYLLIICVLLTWVYSDRLVLGRKIRRFKEWYVTELLTYLIVAPSFFIVLWSFFSSINTKGIAFSSIMSIFYLSGMVLKDLKDISSDLESGYKTLGVVYQPEYLLKVSIFLNFVGNFAIFIFSIVGIIPYLCILSTLPTIIVLYVVIKLKVLGWSLSSDIVNVIRLHPYSYIMSITLLGFTAFIANL